MAVIKTSCECGQAVEIRTGSDSTSSFRTDGKQAVYPNESGYCIFRCKSCRKPLDKTCPAFSYDKRGAGDERSISVVVILAFYVRLHCLRLLDFLNWARFVFADPQDRCGERNSET